MSGHSHWATIKRAKGAADAKKGKIFSKLGKEITIVVKAKGGDPDNNPTLRTLIAKAKAAQMPNDNIERAIKKGTGELESAALVDAQYEGIKGGVALVVNVLTDNKNRAAAEVGNVFKKNGLEFAKQGSASRLFDRLGQVMIPAADGAAGRGSMALSPLLRRSRFEDVDGWETDAVSEAWPAFLRSARHAARGPYRTGALGIEAAAFVDGSFQGLIGVPRQPFLHGAVVEGEASEIL